MTRKSGENALSEDFYQEREPLPRRSRRTNKQRKKARKKAYKTPPLVRLYHCLLCLALVFAVGMLVFQYHSPAPSLPATTTLATADGALLEVSTGRRSGVYNILLVGSDNGDYNADTIMVAQFDGNTGQVNLISVPRDTLVYRTWSNFPKINASFSRGIELLQTEVSYTLGIPIDFYVQVGLNAFIAIVDTMGGLEYHVPEDMYHDDDGGFIIDLTEGLQTLDGHQTLELVRYRGYATADIGRTETQQAVLKAMATQLLTVQTLWNWESYWAVFQDYVDTNLSTSDVLWFAKTLLAKREDFSLYTQTLEGLGNAKYNGYTWCYELDKESTLETVNLYLNPFVEPLTLEDMCLVSAQGYS